MKCLKLKITINSMSDSAKHTLFAKHPIIILILPLTHFKINKILLDRINNFFYQFSFDCEH